MAQKAPNTEQTCYDLGKRALLRRKKVLAITLELSEEQILQRYYQSLNAYRCGQMDRQNQQPRNKGYDRLQYDEDGERRASPIEFEAPP